MCAIVTWRDAGHIDKGPLFRRIETHFGGSVRSVGLGPLQPNSITLIYKRPIPTAFDKKLLGEGPRW